jgi:hypothetical protein
MAKAGTAWSMNTWSDFMSAVERALPERRRLRRLPAAPGHER